MLLDQQHQAQPKCSLKGLGAYDNLSAMYYIEAKTAEGDQATKNP